MCWVVSVGNGKLGRKEGFLAIVVKELDGQSRLEE